MVFFCSYQRQFDCSPVKTAGLAKLDGSEVQGPRGGVKSNKGLVPAARAPLRSSEELRHMPQDPITSHDNITETSSVL